MRRLYEIALRLYPYDFRAMFAADMLAVLVERPPGMREWIAIGLGAAREWLAKLTTDRYVRARCLPDVRMMRPAGISKEVWFGRAPCSSDTSR